MLVGKNTSFSLYWKLKSFFKGKKKVYCSVNQHERHVTWLRIKNIMTFLHSCQARWNTFESDRPRTLSELVAYSRRRFAGGPLLWGGIGYPSLRARSPIWASEAASPLARAFSRASLHSPKYSSKIKSSFK